MDVRVPPSKFLYFLDWINSLITFKVRSCRKCLMLVTRQNPSNPARSTLFMFLYNWCQINSTFVAPFSIHTLIWPTPWISRTSVNVWWICKIEDAFAFLYLISLTWRRSRMASRSLWRYWKTTSYPVCPQLRETSWVIMSWWKTWK